MVGVPKSRGCEVCRKRKIKCGEERPACIQCIKGNRLCPGYTSRLKFQDEGPQLKKRYSISGSKPPSPPRRDRQTSSSSSSSLVSRSRTPSIKFEIVTIPPDSPDDSSDGNDQEGLTPQQAVAELQKAAFVYSRSGPVTFPQSPENRLAGLFLETIFPTLPSGKNLIVFGGFLTQVPVRLGSNEALDDAVETLYVAHQGFLQGRVEGITQSRRQYGRALRSLQRFISSQEKGVEAETLLATILLSIYEMFAATDSRQSMSMSWIKHAGGCARMIEARGADRYENFFERELLASQRGPIIVEAILRRESCFLDSPHWTAIFKKQRSTMPSEHAPYDDLLIYMAKIPGLLKTVTALRSEVAPARSAVMAVRAKALDTRQGLVQFEASMPTPDKFKIFETKPERPNETPWSTVFSYENNQIAGLASVHNACLIIINTIIENLPEPVPGKQELHNESVMLSERILRSWDYAMRFQPFGSMYMWYSMRAAWVVLDDIVIKRWVVDRMNEGMANLLLDGYEEITLGNMDVYFGDFVGPVGVVMRDE